MESKLTPERAKRMMAMLRLWAFERRQYERLDRYCHGGIVSYRLPLITRIDADNRFARTA